MIQLHSTWTTADKMSNDMTSEQMQAKIAGARREAEGLKDRIKRKKDDLADTSCKREQVLVVLY